MSDILLTLQLSIEPHLKRIEKLLGGRYTLTLVARYTGPEPLDDSDIVLSMDSMPKAIAALERLAARDPTFTPKPAQEPATSSLSAVEIRLSSDGALDEVCAPNFHLEQMDSNHWWMAIDDARGSVHVNLHARGKITATISDERAHGPGGGPLGSSTSKPNIKTSPPEFPDNSFDSPTSLSAVEQMRERAAKIVDYQDMTAQEYISITNHIVRREVDFERGLRRNLAAAIRALPLSPQTGEPK